MINRDIGMDAPSCSLSAEVSTVMVGARVLFGGGTGSGFCVIAQLMASTRVLERVREYGILLGAEGRPQGEFGRGTGGV